MVWWQGTGPLAAMLFSLALFGGASSLCIVFSGGFIVFPDYPQTKEQSLPGIFSTMIVLLRFFRRKWC
jgi:hypothetical protein